MAKAGFTSLPCPGCGEKINRRKDSVCSECHSAMETGRMHKKGYQKMIEKGFVECNIPSNWEQPYYSAYKVNSHSKTYKKIGKIMKELVYLLIVKSGMRPTWGYIHYLENSLAFEPIQKAVAIPVIFKKDTDYNKNYEWQANAILPKSVYDKLTELHNQIEDTIKETEEKAVEYGKNALIMLGDGHLTIDDFNKK